MGICLSCSKAEKAAEKEEEEEEVEVKEVLSETPKPKLIIPSIPIPIPIPTAIEQEQAQINTSDAHHDGPKPPPEIRRPAAETFSAPAAAESEHKKARNETVEASTAPAAAGLRRKRSVSGELAPCACGRDGCGGTSRSSPSPAKRMGGGGDGVGRTLSAREAGPAARQWRGAPVVRAGGARREPPRPAESAARGREEGNEYLMAGKESLENPLVSLECFIFL